MSDQPTDQPAEIDVLDEAARRDLDETRRLLYMARAARHTDRYNLVGTLTNALAHHGLGVDPAEAFTEVLAAVVSGEDRWLRDQIAQVNDVLDRAGPPAPPRA